MAQRAQLCTPGYSNQNGQCKKCDSGKTSDGGDGACYCDAGTQRFLGNLCTPCQRHQYSIKNTTQCIECAQDELSGPLQRKCMKSSECDLDSGFVIEHQSCVCPSNMYLSLNESTCVNKCGDNETSNSISDPYHFQSNCFCKNGFVIAPGGRNCILLDDCSESNNMKLDGYSCTCKDNSVLPKFDAVTGATTCVARQSCKTAQYYVPSTDSCNECPENAQSAGGQAESCACVPGFVNVSGNCVLDIPNCELNHFLDNNTCKPCPVNFTSPGGVSTSCECVEDGSKLIDGKCQSTSEQNEQKINKSQAKTIAIAVPVVLVVFVAILVAAFVPLVKRKRNNHFRGVMRSELV